jgi:hypothetical protein
MKQFSESVAIIFFKTIFAFTPTGTYQFEKYTEPYAKE